MTIPDAGIQILLDASELRISQDQPKDDGATFRESCHSVTKLVKEFFTPTLVESTGIVAKYFWQFGSSETSFTHTLALAGAKTDALSDAAQMPPLFSVMHHVFQSGSFDFHVKIEPVNFERMARFKFTAPHGATSTQKKRYEGLNKFNENFDTDLSYGLALDLDLIENTPAKDSLEKHFSLFKTKRDAILKFFAKI